MEDEFKNVFRQVEDKKEIRSVKEIRETLKNSWMENVVVFRRSNVSIQKVI